MANTKYETIVKDLEQYYSPNCPIILSAYAVLLDTTDSKYGAQLKLTNCSGVQIDSVSLTIKTYDHFGNLSEEVNNCQYVNVNASYGNSFGTQTLIPLSKDVPVKNLKVTINNIVFGNGSDWRSGDGAVLENKLQLQGLTSILSEEEMETYCFITNSKMKYIPSQEGLFWGCSCGAANYDGQICNACGAEKEKVFQSLDKSVLQDEHNKKEYDDAIKLRNEQSVESLEKAIVLFENLRNYKDSVDLATACRDELVLAKKAAEEKRLEEELQAEIRRKEQEEKAKKNKKIAVIAAAIAAICAVVFFIVTKVIIPNNNYNKAIALVENGDYNDALLIFEELGTYKDSKDRAEEAQKAVWYEEGNKYMEQDDYSKAVELFEKSVPYGDSENKLEEAQTKKEEQEQKEREARELEEKENKYQSVLLALEEGNYKGLKEILESLGDYKDSADILAELIEYEKAIALLNSEDSYKGIDSFLPAMELIDNGKYVRFPEETIRFVKFYGPFLGEWEYSTGDERLLSYTGKDSSKWKDIERLEIVYTVSYGGGKQTIQVYTDTAKKGMYASLPTADMDAGTITQNNYVGGKFVFSITEEDTLLVDFYGKSGMPEHLTVEYSRVE